MPATGKDMEFHAARKLPQCHGKFHRDWRLERVLGCADLGSSYIRCLAPEDSVEEEAERWSTLRYWAVVCHDYVLLIKLIRPVPASPVSFGCTTL